MAHFEGQPLKVIRLYLGRVVQSYVMRGAHSSLSYMLRYEVEVIEIPPGDRVVNNRSRVGVIVLAVASFYQHSCVDSLLNYDVAYTAV